MTRARLTVWRFHADHEVESAVQMARSLGRRHVDIADAATVSWVRGRRMPDTSQLTPTGACAAVSGSFWGLLFEVTFFVPLMSATTGSRVDAPPGSLADLGIEDKFVNQLRDQITPGTWALLVVASETAVDTLMDALGRHEPSDLISTQLAEPHQLDLRHAMRGE
jgi:uncharacterized membrane protein